MEFVGFKVVVDVFPLRERRLFAGISQNRWSYDFPEWIERWYTFFDQTDVPNAAWRRIRRRKNAIRFMTMSSNYPNTKNKPKKRRKKCKQKIHSFVLLQGPPDTMEFQFFLYFNITARKCDIIDFVFLSSVTEAHGYTHTNIKLPKLYWKQCIFQHANYLWGKCDNCFKRINMVRK